MYYEKLGWERPIIWVPGQWGDAVVRGNYPLAPSGIQRAGYTRIPHGLEGKKQMEG